MHPFKVLVTNFEQETETDPANIELVPVPTKDPEISEGSTKAVDSKDLEEPESPEVSADVEGNDDGIETCEVVVEVSKTPDELEELLQDQKENEETMQGCNLNSN